MIIRKARLEDYAAVSALEELEFGVHRSARPDYFKDLSESYSKAEFEELLAAPCPIAWLAEIEGQVAGLCFGEVKDTPENSVCKSRRVAFLQDLATLPQYRGQGIATALLARARQQAVAEGAEGMELCVWGFNENAVRLYEKLGMKIQYYRMEERLQGD